MDPLPTRPSRCLVTPSVLGQWEDITTVSQLHQNESQWATLIAAAKAMCSQAVSEAKTNY